MVEEAIVGEAGESKVEDKDTDVGDGKEGECLSASSEDGDNDVRCQYIDLPSFILASASRTSIIEMRAEGYSSLDGGLPPTKRSRAAQSIAAHSPDDVVPR